MNDSLSLGRLLAQAYSTRTPIDALPAAALPADDASAYATQDAVLAALDDTIGGWKVGAATGAPLPACGVTTGETAVYSCGERAPLGIELEIAFRFSRRFEPSDTPYSDAEVLGAIALVGATIEVVASRYAAYPDVERRAQLADLLNHGALAAGEFVPYREDLPFVAPSLSLTLDGQSVFSGTPANPAGDPRQLLPWLVNHATRERRVAITPEQVITTGSYVGLVRFTGTGIVVGQIAGLPPVALTLA